MKALFIFILSFYFISLLPASEVLKGKVVGVMDGNTLELLTSDNETYKIQLAGVDCPEPEQPFGPEAKYLLEKSLKGKNVEAVIQGKNRWGVRQGIVTTKNGPDPRVALLSLGLAWTAEKNAVPVLESIRVNAKAKKLGLWIDKDPTPPWVYRRQQTMQTPKFR
jgi:endonuclease YncB( thermonuclease family)